MIFLDNNHVYNIIMAQFFGKIFLYCICVYAIMNPRLRLWDFTRCSQNVWPSTYSILHDIGMGRGSLQHSGLETS